MPNPTGETSGIIQVLGVLKRRIGSFKNKGLISQTGGTQLRIGGINNQRQDQKRNFFGTGL
jgi:hypothetical protein